MGNYDGAGEVIAFCPTRENPEGARDMVASFYDTVERIETEVILVVDRSDPRLNDYLSMAGDFTQRRVKSGGVLRPDPVTVMIVEGGTLTKATNEGVARIWDEDCIIGHVGDDHRFRTRGWDTAIRTALLERPGVAYAYDGFPSIWASAWWTNSLVIRTLGWLAEPGTMHLAIDDIFMDLGAGLGRLTYLPDVLIEHLHPSGGKVPWRAIVKSHYAPDKRVLEWANLARYRKDDFANDIHKLQDALGDERTEVTDLEPATAWRKEYIARTRKERQKNRWVRQEPKIR